MVMPTRRRYEAEGGSDEIGKHPRKRLPLAFERP